MKPSEIIKEKTKKSANDGTSGSITDMFKAILEFLDEKLT